MLLHATLQRNALDQYVRSAVANARIDGGYDVADLFVSPQALPDVDVVVTYDTYHMPQHGDPSRVSGLYKEDLMKYSTRGNVFLTMIRCSQTLQKQCFAMAHFQDAPKPLRFEDTVQPET